MSENGSEKSLAERMKEREEESNRACLQAQAEALESFRASLQSSFRSELSTIEGAIKSESEALRRNWTQLFKLNRANLLLVGLAIWLAAVAMSGLLSWYLSSRIQSQRDELLSQQELVAKSRQEYLAQTQALRERFESDKRESRSELNALLVQIEANKKELAMQQEALKRGAHYQLMGGTLWVEVTGMAPRMEGDRYWAEVQR